MKTKLVKNRRDRSEQLSVRTTKGESLDYAQAELLRVGAVEGLFPFDYETQRDGSVRFLYLITDTVPLETYLKAKLSPTQFRTMLDDVIDCFERCATNGLDPTRLLFDHDLMRLDARSNHLLFAYLPAQGLPGNRSTVMDLLRHVAEHASFVCEDNKADAETLLDYLKRQTLFSAVGFKEFLESTAFRSSSAASGPNARLGSDSARFFSDERARTSRSSAPLAGSQGLAAKPSGATDERLKAGGTPAAFDFVKAQSGAPSSREARASQSLAEQVAFDVAEPQRRSGRADQVQAMPEAMAPSTQTAAVEQAQTPKAPSTSLLGSSPLAREAAPCASPEHGMILVRVRDGARFNLDLHGKTTVGRSKRCAAHVTGNPNISRHHATVAFADGICLIEDEGSLNRTCVNSETLAPHEPRALARGDAVFLADEEFRVE